MISEKIVSFHDKNKDLNQLAQQIITTLDADGYKTQLTTNSPTGIIIQAKKAGILRDIITADRAFTIMITGDSNNFAIHIGIGKWVQNIAVAAAEALLLSVLFLAIDIPEMLWTKHVENEVLKKIIQLI
ncbi:hypothetical protein [Candidatus Nitrosotalea okcheonensis]|uniref:Uncharacterized protein n=1 Tax=Candidatus Nitrosotalea okcheonensis TaxID=1903276 RepID=A0A2H1FE37_9ARCH|nr:hypothetical protein [Candidatus Nitrosotalea okcheonensis]SMH71028.1 conserved protein of unknown function [Candidatus Nitrosotalea okcheonensis]